MVQIGYYPARSYPTRNHHPPSGVCVALPLSFFTFLLVQGFDLVIPSLIMKNFRNFSVFWRKRFTFFVLLTIFINSWATEKIDQHSVEWTEAQVPPTTAPLCLSDCYTASVNESVRGVCKKSMRRSITVKSVERNTGKYNNQCSSQFSVHSAAFFQLCFKRYRLWKCQKLFIYAIFMRIRDHLSACLHCLPSYAPVILRKGIATMWSLALQKFIRSSWFASWKVSSFCNFFLAFVGFKAFFPRNDRGVD